MYYVVFHLVYPIGPGAARPQIGQLLHLREGIGGSALPKQFVADQEWSNQPGHIIESLPLSSISGPSPFRETPGWGHLSPPSSRCREEAVLVASLPSLQNALRAAERWATFRPLDIEHLPAGLAARPEIVECCAL